MSGRRSAPPVRAHRHIVRRGLLHVGAALLAAGAALAPGRLAAQGPFTSFTVFGDSYSDTGNLLQLTLGALPPSPPYAVGRYSNGPIWVDDLTARLGLAGDAAPSFVALRASGDYAIAGARTNGSIPPGTQTQIAAYLARPGASAATLTDHTGLYAIFAGGDDLRDVATETDPATRQADAAAAAQRVVTQAGQLAAAGARNILLFTLPSLSVTPEAQRIAGRPAIDDAIGATFNSTLAAGIAGLQTSFAGDTFYDFRLDTLFASILADANGGGTAYGLTNVATPCFDAGAPSCNVSVFADSLHPTTRTHALIADAVYTYVTTGANVTATPEPATVVLVAGGLLAVLGVARARSVGRRLSPGTRSLAPESPRDRAPA